LLKRRYEEAWRWYEQAQLELRQIDQPDTAAQYVRALRSPSDNAMFEYVCLSQLGRHDEAALRLRHFRKTFPPPLPDLRLGQVVIDGRPLEERIREMMAPDGFAANLVRDLYAAEVFLSVDAAEAGEDHFRRAIADAAEEKERLSAAIALAQLLLLQDKRNRYVELATTEIVSSIVAIDLPAEFGLDGRWLDVDGVLLVAGAFSLLPIASEEFLVGVDEALVAELAETGERLRARSHGERSNWLVDVGLANIYGRMGQAELRAETAARLGSNHHTIEGDEWKQRIIELRAFLRQLSGIGWPPR
jgi:hypothetical protein